MIKPETIKQFIEKVVVNSGIGRLSQNPNFNDKILPDVIAEFGAITGQKPATRPARESIAGFKIREGNIVGLSATLRGNRMADFLMKVVSVVLPRVRDFRGVPVKAVDRRGNLTIGIKENIVFPEISAEISKTSFGLQLTVVPKVQNREKAMDFYKSLGIPFAKEIVKKHK
jgi:large subunit ribosomal protein L5